MSVGQDHVSIGTGKRILGTSWHRTRIHGAPATLWLPALVICLIVLLPLFYLMLRTAQGGIELLDLLWRGRTLTLVRNTLVLTLIVTAGSIIVSLPLAWLINRTDLPWRRFWATVTILPLAIPSYVGGFVVIAMLGPRGILQGWLESLFGITRLPEIYGLFGASLTLTMLIYPYVLLTLNGAMSGLDPALEEASRSMGYGAWATFFRVSVPLLRPAIAAGSLLVALYTIGEFGAVSLLQYDTFTRAIYTQYSAAFDRTLAAGLAMLLVGLTGIVLLVEAWTRGQARYYRSSSGGGKTANKIRLGRWKPVAVGYCATIVTIALIIPIGVIVYWLVRGLRAGEPLAVVWDAIWHSAYVSGLAAVVSVLAATPIVIFAVRYPGRLSGLLERLSYAGYALPGIVIALSLVFFGANYAFWLYQTVAMLILAYVVRFLPQAVGALRTSLLQISPRLEEAGRSLGYSSPRVWLSITAPLVRGGLFGGMALVFLTVMKELPATLLLRPIGFDTLATRIWSAAAEGFWARAAAPALLLILISGLSMFFLGTNTGTAEQPIEPGGVRTDRGTEDQ